MAIQALSTGHAKRPKRKFMSDDTQGTKTKWYEWRLWEFDPGWSEGVPYRSVWMDRRSADELVEVRTKSAPKTTTVKLQRREIIYGDPEDVEC